uniref:RNA-binding protein squid n=1 Tax=Cacopsylla melanoneura TaxID=428564 RepID=A0A8D8WI81_9HEMI
MSKTVNIKANYTFNSLNPLEAELAKLNLTNVPCPVAEISYVPTLPMMENGSTQTDSSEEQRKLFIGSISLTTTGDELKNHFSKYGEVERININFDFKSGQTQGYAYVVFKNKNVVEKVLSSGDSIFDYSSNKNVIEERKKIKARKSKTSLSEAAANGKMNGAKGLKKGEKEESAEDSNDEGKQCDNSDNAKKQSRKRKRNKAKASKQYILVENIIHLNEKDVASFFAKFNIDLYYPIDDQASSNKDYCIVMTNDKTQSDAILKITRPIINGIKLRINPMRNMPDDYLNVKNRDIEDFKLFYGDIESGEVVLEPINSSAQ